MVREINPWANGIADFYRDDLVEDPANILLTGCEISAGSRKQHPELLQLSEGPGEIIWGYQNRLG